MPPSYEIRIAGPFDTTAVDAFAGLDVTAVGCVTVVRGEFDQASLHGLIERIRTLRLELVEACRVRGSPGSRAGGQHRRGPDPEGGLMAGHAYEIRVVGSLGPAARDAFTDVAVEVEPTATVLCGDLDQAGLHAVLDRVRALGLELMDIRRVPDSHLPDAFRVRPR